MLSCFIFYVLIKFITTFKLNKLKTQLLLTFMDLHEADFVSVGAFLTCKLFKFLGVSHGNSILASFNAGGS